MKRVASIAAAALFVAAPLASQSPAAEDSANAAAAFTAMRALEGTWRPVGEGDSPLRIHFSLTARGTVLVEEWRGRGKPHSLTLYHRDGAGLLATHYCPQGNQPRLRMVQPSIAIRPRFLFQDATDLDADSESYAVEVAFDIGNTGRLTRTEIYRRAGEDEVSTLTLERVANANP